MCSLSDSEALLRGKGWSYSNVYSLRELRDVYLLIEQNENKSNKEISSLIQKHVVPEGKSWDSSGRKALEYINALTNFNLIHKNDNKKAFRGAVINSDLSKSDIDEFKQIFLNYFRFKEIIAWFSTEKIANIDQYFFDINFLKNDTKPLFYFSSYTRFTDSIIYDLKDNTDVYLLNPEMSHLMRFWDVFIKWGITLDLIEKFSLHHTDYRVFDRNNVFKHKNLSCCYFLSEQKNIDIIDFIIKNYRSRHIYIPDLLLKVVLSYRMRVVDVKNQLLEQARSNGSVISFERTSSVFLKKGEFKENEDLLFLKIAGSYVTHLTLRI